MSENLMNAQKKKVGLLWFDKHAQAFEVLKAFHTVEKLCGFSLKS